MTIKASEIITDKVKYAIDVSFSDAMATIIESQFGDQVYSVKREYVIDCGADEILDVFLSQHDNQQPNYRIFSGYSCYVWTNDWAVRIFGDFGPRVTVSRKRFDNEIMFIGRSRSMVTNIINKFEEAMGDSIVPPHHFVDMVVRGNHGLERIGLPVKTDRKFYPELYPCIEEPDSFIKRFINSSANVLILTGPPGMGKSALINSIILSAELPTSIVFDPDVMSDDHLYTDFINKSLRNEGGLMIMEDADIVLTDRVVSKNTTMSKLLNLSDGIVDTSGAKFIFSANLSGKEDIDDALTRPGRCFDIVEFRPLTYEEASRAAKAIGVELYEEKSEYTVAEIFNSTNNRKVKRKVGFI